MAENLLAGLAQGFSQGKIAGQQNKQQKEMRDLQVKAFKANLEAEAAKKSAVTQFQSMMSGSNAPMAGMEGPPMAQQTTPGKSFMEMMTDPQGQLAGLMSGMATPKDIGLAEDRQRMKKFIDNLSGGSTTDLGFTPESLRVFSQTADPKSLEAIKPIQKEYQDEKTNAARIGSFNPYTGKLIADLGPSKENTVPVGDSGKVQSIQFAKDQLNNAINLLSPDGKLDSTTVYQLASPIKWGVAREIDNNLSEAIATKVLIQSGVTARQDEIDRAKDRFIPTPLDLTKPGLAEKKLENLRNFMEGTLDLTVLPPSLRKRIEDQNKKPSLNLKKVTPDKIKSLSDAELQAIIDGKR